MFWVDLLLFIILGLYAFIGLVRGFLRSAIRFTNSAISVVVGLLLAPTFALLFTSVLGLDTVLSQVISNSVSGYCVSSSGTQLDNAFLHNFAEITLGHEYWLNYAGGVESAEFIAKFSYMISDALLVLISFFVVSGLVRIITLLVCGCVRAINRKRAYGWIARSFGAVVSLFEGIFVLWVVFCMLGFILPIAPATHNAVTEILSANPVTNWLFGITNDFLNALLLPWLMRFFV